MWKKNTIHRFDVMHNNAFRTQCRISVKSVHYSFTFCPIFHLIFYFLLWNLLLLYLYRYVFPHLHIFFNLLTCDSFFPAFLSVKWSCTTRGKKIEQTHRPKPKKTQKWQRKWNTLVILGHALKCSLIPHDYIISAALNSHTE